MASFVRDRSKSFAVPGGIGQVEPQSPQSAYFRTNSHDTSSRMNKKKTNYLHGVAAPPLAGSAFPLPLWVVGWVGGRLPPPPLWAVGALGHMLRF